MKRQVEEAEEEIDRLESSKKKLQRELEDLAHTGGEDLSSHLKEGQQVSHTREAVGLELCSTHCHKDQPRCLILGQI